MIRRDGCGVCDERPQDGTMAMLTPKACAELLKGGTLFEQPILGLNIAKSAQI